jgi:toxin YoeB
LADEIGKIVRQDVVPKFSNSETAASNIIFEVDPYTGIGKPEPLKYELAGYWSRRINSEHRIIYSVHDDIVTNILNFYEISL